jgi:hypothetical protein
VDVIRRERNTMAKVRSGMQEKLDKATKTYQDVSRKYRMRAEVTGDMKSKILDLKDRNQEQQHLYMNEFDNLSVLSSNILAHFFRKKSSWTKRDLLHTTDITKSKRNMKISTLSPS